MGRTQVFLVVATIVVLALMTGGFAGFQVSCHLNSGCYVGGSSSLAGVIAAPVLCAFVLFYPQRTATTTLAEPVKIWERFAAFFVDYLVLLCATIPIATLLMLTLEAEATGVFGWRFFRSYLRSTDVFAIIIFILLFAVLFAYFYVHARIGRQTVGQYLLGFRVEGIPSDGERPKFGLNVFLGFVGLCAWPISVFLAADREDKAFWWNLRARTRLTRVA